MCDSAEGVQMLKGGRGGDVCLISHKSLKIPHENEIIWLQRGVGVNPLNPL